MIFIATNQNIIRQIKPLLSFYYASDIPVYAISSVYSGNNIIEKDQDINGVQIYDMPWILDKTIKSKKIYKIIKRNWDNSLTNNPRLFALGIDSYNISKEFKNLAQTPTSSISGMSGLLKILPNNQINREQLWGVIAEGKVNLLNH